MNKTIFNKARNYRNDQAIQRLANIDDTKNNSYQTPPTPTFIPPKPEKKRFAYGLLLAMRP